MKSSVDNILWIILILLLVSLIVTKLDQNTKDCTNSITEINNKLISGQEFTYEEN